MTKAWTMGRDQYGQTWHDLGTHPRAALLERTGYKTARPMFIDCADGGHKHVGYVLTLRGSAPLWVTIYTVAPWNKRNSL